MEKKERYTNFIRSFAVTAFYADVGQVCQAVVPDGDLSPAEQQAIACLSLPDSNTSSLTDVVYCFRLRRCVASAQASVCE